MSFCQSSCLPYLLERSLHSVLFTQDFQITVCIMDSTSPTTSVPEDQQNDTGCLHLQPRGDVILVVGGATTELTKRFLVSSEILQLASPYFGKMFSSSFVEGRAVANKDEDGDRKCPEVSLQEDDPEAMEIILSILHYRFLDSYQRLEPEMLAIVALHSDKYRCNNSLQPWINKWVTTIRQLETVEEYGLLLTATHLFGIPEHFQSASVSAIRHVPQSFEEVWSQHDIISLLPQEVRGETCKRKKKHRYIC